jgi:RecA/RadA recombinase
VVKASDATAPMIPSGSVTLDYILGGGWPANQWVELIGEASSGKWTSARPFHLLKNYGETPG